MKKLKFVLLIVLMLFYVNVYATDDEKCDSKESARLKELAKKVEFDYDYKVVDNVANFSIKAINLNEELRVLIINNYFNDDYKEFTEANGGILDGFISGERVVITIKGFVPNACSGVTVLTKTIKLPYYNIFYDEENCKDNSDFKYCQLLLKTNISEKEYIRAWNDYQLNKNNQEEVEIPITSKDYTNIILIIVSSVLSITAISLITVKIVQRRKKNRL